MVADLIKVKSMNDDIQESQWEDRLTPTARTSGESSGTGIEKKPIRNF